MCLLEFTNLVHSSVKVCMAVLTDLFKGCKKHKRIRHSSLHYTLYKKSKSCQCMSVDLMWQNTFLLALQKWTQLFCCVQASLHPPADDCNSLGCWHEILHRFYWIIYKNITFPPQDILKWWLSWVTSRTHIPLYGTYRGSASVSAIHIQRQYAPWIRTFHQNILEMDAN